MRLLMHSRVHPCTHVRANLICEMLLREYALECECIFTRFASRAALDPQQTIAAAAAATQGKRMLASTTSLLVVACMSLRIGNQIPTSTSRFPLSLLFLSLSLHHLVDRQLLIETPRDEQLISPAFDACFRSSSSMGDAIKVRHSSSGEWTETHAGIISRRLPSCDEHLDCMHRMLDARRRRRRKGMCFCEDRGTSAHACLAS